MSAAGGAAFVRFDVDFFDVPAVRVILAAPKGDAVIVFFWQLVSIAGRANAEDGGVEIGQVAATAETLAAYTGRRVAFVGAAVAKLTAAGLLEAEGARLRIAEWGRLLLPDVARKIREDARARKAAQRERQRATQDDAGNVVSAMPSDARLQIPADGGDQAKVAILRALIETGKFRSLLYEHVVRVMQEHPRAELEKNFPEIVSEARSVSYNVITNALAWLRRAVSNMESRKAGGTRVAVWRNDSPKPISKEITIGGFGE